LLFFFKEKVTLSSPEEQTQARKNEMYDNTRERERERERDRELSGWRRCLGDGHRGDALEDRWRRG